MEITVKRREVYGRVLYYPACEVSEQLVKLTSGITFTLAHMNALHQAGIKVTFAKETGQ